MDIIDCWASEDFEDSVASALIAIYEDKLKRNRGAGPHRLKPKHLSYFRKIGAFIPSNSRYIIAPVNGVGQFDTLNDKYQDEGCIGFVQGSNVEWDAYGGYFMAIGFKKSPLGKNWDARINGASYQLTIIAATDKGVTGEVRYFTASASGQIESCSQSIRSVDGIGRAVTLSQCDFEPKILGQTTAWASFAMQYEADRRHCWAIKAEEHTAKVTLGCMKEEVKSLLYARSLPMTATGRKRPVLHLVEAHKRRLKNGIDIDITPFLRGTQNIIINGTRFSVIPPKAKAPDLSENSQRYYTDEDKPSNMRAINHG